MKKASFTFKHVGAAGYFKCVKATNSTKYLPGTVYSEAEIKKMVARATANETINLV